MTGYPRPDFAIASNETQLRAGQPEFAPIERIMTDWARTRGTHWVEMQFSHSPEYGYIVRAALIRGPGRARYVYWYRSDGEVQAAAEFLSLP
jgi:hypothetical protein